MSIKIKTISTVQLPPPKCRKNLFHVVLTAAGCRTKQHTSQSEVCFFCAYTDAGIVFAEASYICGQQFAAAVFYFKP